jgi:hypothetical protein
VQHKANVVLLSDSHYPEVAADLLVYLVSTDLSPVLTESKANRYLLGNPLLVFLGAPSAGAHPRPSQLRMVLQRIPLLVAETLLLSLFSPLTLD